MGVIYVETTIYTDVSSASVTYSDTSRFKSQELVDGLQEGDHESDDDLYEDG